MNPVKLGGGGRHRPLPPTVYHAISYQKKQHNQSRNDISFHGNQRVYGYIGASELKKDAAKLFPSR